MTVLMPAFVFTHSATNSQKNILLKQHRLVSHHLRCTTQYVKEQMQIYFLLLIHCSAERMEIQTPIIQTGFSTGSERNQQGIFQAGFCGGAAGCFLLVYYLHSGQLCLNVLSI